MNRLIQNCNSATKHFGVVITVAVVVTAYLDLLASTSFAAGANTPRPGPQTVVALRAACRESLDSGLEAHYTVTAALQAASWASAFTLGS